MNKILILLAVLLGGFLLSSRLSSTIEVTEDNRKELPSRRDLQRAAWNSDTWLIVYPSANQEEAKTYERILQPLKTMKARGVQVRVMPLDQTPDSLLQNYPVILLGTRFPDNVQKSINALPSISIDSQSLNIGELHLAEASDFAQLTYLPSPWSSQWPLYLIWSKETSTLQQQLQHKIEAGLRSFLWSSWGYEVIRNQEIHCLGYFNDSTWVMDKKIHFEFNPVPNLLHERASARFWAFDGAQPKLEGWPTKLDSIQATIQDFTGAKQLSSLQLYFYPSVERKALATGKMEQAHLNPQKMQVHLVSNAYFRGEEWGEHYRPWLKEALGDAPTTVLEQGLALQWIDQLRGRPWRDWVYHLALANALPPISMLYKEEEIAEQAPVIGQLAAGAWVDYCLQTIGKEAFLQSYRSGKSAIPDNQRTEAAWKEWIIQQYAVSAVEKAALPDQRLDGFTFAHEGYRIYNGYGGSTARQSLEAMSADGIDAIAIVPYSYMRDATKATPIPVARRAGTENDEACLFSHFSAKELGQFTLLKPQIWLGGGSWPGDVNFDTQAEWDNFFAYYRRWIMHYALQAEMYGFDALCIGTELRHTTLQQPAAWRALIADIRKVYHGTLTYAANWGEECEQITFWQELDFIGVNAYYPLHKKEAASDEDLLAGARKMLARIGDIQQANQRPVWLTEVGYRSASSPWINPHAEAGDRNIDENAQARCYQALFTAAEEAEWLKGFFWWKWPANMEHNESDGRGYMPLGKKAEAVLRKYYLVDE